MAGEAFTAPSAAVLLGIEHWVPRTADRCAVEPVVDIDMVAQDLNSSLESSDIPARRVNMIARVVVVVGKIGKVVRVVVAADKAVVVPVNP